MIWNLSAVNSVTNLKLATSNKPLEGQFGMRKSLMFLTFVHNYKIDTFFAFLSFKTCAGNDVYLYFLKTKHDLNDFWHCNFIVLKDDVYFPTYLVTLGLLC